MSDTDALADAFDLGHAAAHGYDLTYDLDRQEWLEEHGAMARAKNPWRGDE